MLFSTIPEWLLLAATCFILFYKYATRYKDYWKIQNIPYEKLTLYFGSTFQLLTRPSHLVDQDLYKKYGRLFGSFEDCEPVLYVAKPELVKLILVKDFTTLPYKNNISSDDPLLSNMISRAKLDQWRRLRAAATPAFTTGKIRKVHDTLTECARLMCDKLNEAAKNNEEKDFRSVFGHYSLDAIARCMFGTNLELSSQEREVLVHAGTDIFFAKITFRATIQALVLTLVQALRNDLMDKEEYRTFAPLVKAMMSRRQQTKYNHDDYMQIILDACETETPEATVSNKRTSSGTSDVASDSPLTDSHNKKKLTEQEAVSQCVTVFIGGPETLSSTTAFAVYLLALHPEVQNKLREEVDSCFEKHGECPSYDVVSNLNYLNAVVSETLRMYPPGTRIERTPSQSDYVLGEKGVTVKQNMRMIIPVYAMHYDPDFFPDPDKFNPDRFSKENIHLIQPYTYLPFGAGPRNCLGSVFALMTVKICILHAIRHARFVPTSKTKVPLEFRPGLGNLFPYDVTVGIRKR